MRSILLFVCAMLLPLGLQTALAQDAAFTVTYIEALPSAKADAAALVKEYADASRGQDGVIRFEALRRLDRPSHFAIVAVWKDPKAAEIHAAANTTKQFRTKLQPLLSSPYDERPHAGLSVGPVSGSGKLDGGVYAVTHVDIIPPKKDDGIAAIKELSEPSRKEAGALRYEALQQNSRPNHFTLVEVWKSQDELERHESASHTRSFRDLLLPMSGSLYDQRLYTAL
jgi:quinol monooxygenase YgiN